MGKQGLGSIESASPSQKISETPPGRCSNGGWMGPVHDEGSAFCLGAAPPVLFGLTCFDSCIRFMIIHKRGHVLDFDRRACAGIGWVVLISAEIEARSFEKRAMFDRRRMQPCTPRPHIPCFHPCMPQYLLIDRAPYHGHHTID